MEAPGSLGEWEVCFHTTCNEVPKLAASRCNVGPSRQLFSEDSSTQIYPGHSLQREQLWSLAQEAPNLWISVGVCNR